MHTATAVRLSLTDATDAPATKPASLQQAFAHCCDGLYRFVLVRVGGDRHAADDLLQQTCATAAGHARPPTQADECEAWLRGIARNLIRRHWRQRRRDNGHVPLEDAAGSRRLAEDMASRPLPPEILSLKESLDQLLLAVTALPSADQRLIFEFYFDGRLQADIAHTMGVTRKTIETRLYRARRQLRAILQGPGRTELR
ncbi:MAG: sigma-70 family RNA polymerase sigma factor [Phycisphaerae bacterium]